MNRNFVRNFVNSKPFIRYNGIAQQVRKFAISSRMNKDFNFPTSPNDMPRAGGVASMMRLPIERSAQGLDACFVGIPLDSGTSNRSGTR